MSLEGQQFGQYRLHKLIKSGNKSDMYQAESVSQPQQVIVTVMSLDAMYWSGQHAAKEAIIAFRREATKVSNLKHPYLNPLLSYGEETLGGINYSYLVTPASVDGTLNDYLQRNSELLEPEDVTRVISQVAAALQYIHTQHLVHGEVKPSNIVIQRCDVQHIYEVRLDGLAMTRCIAALYPTSAIRGNPTYLAPEQWSAHSSPASDEYALAILAYKLFTGHAPFQGTLEELKQQHLHARVQPARTLNREISGKVDDVLLRALAKDPRDRYHSIDVFAQTLHQAIQPGSEAQAQLQQKHGSSTSQHRDKKGSITTSESTPKRGLSTGAFVSIVVAIISALGVIMAAMITRPSPTPTPSPLNTTVVTANPNLPQLKSLYVGRYSGYASGNMNLIIDSENQQGNLNGEVQLGNAQYNCSGTISIIPLGTEKISLNCTKDTQTVLKLALSGTDYSDGHIEGNFQVTDTENINYLHQYQFSVA